MDDRPSVGSVVPAGSLVLLVGPPAAGKSTLAAALVAAGDIDGADVLSSDDLRRTITGDALDTSRERKVFAELRRALERRMAAGRTTVVDATNLWPRRRARHIRVARSHGRPVVAVLFEVPDEELVRRNAGRDRQVPIGGLLTMARQLREHVSPEALRDEGVDVVVDAADLADRL